jgi:hypothetical protein
MAPIERITLFKIPNEADRDRVLEQYKVLAKTATKVCTYITQLEYLLVIPMSLHYHYSRDGFIRNQPNGY